MGDHITTYSQPLNKRSNKYNSLTQLYHKIMAFSLGVNVIIKIARRTTGAKECNFLQDLYTLYFSFHSNQKYNLQRI